MPDTEAKRRAEDNSIAVQTPAAPVNAIGVDGYDTAYMIAFTWVRLESIVAVHAALRHGTGYYFSAKEFR
ncbi:MAG: hypothetical protein ABL931_02925 [Usitatibacteraceae bacterium]